MAEHEEMSVLGLIQQCVVAYRSEMGTEPDRVCMDMIAYRRLMHEIRDRDVARARAAGVRTPRVWRMENSIDGLLIELPDYPPSILCGLGYIAVDRKPEQQDEGE